MLDGRARDGFVSETDGVLPAPLVPGDLGEKGVAHRVQAIMDEDAVCEIFVAVFYGEVKHFLRPARPASDRLQNNLDCK